jgi:glycerol-3-phosphate cytidylyltransferase-like family protein
MMEAGTGFRCQKHDDDIKEIKTDTKTDIKEVKSEMKEMGISITVIRIDSVEMKADLKTVLSTYKAVKTSAIGFFVLNILMAIWTVWKNFK